MSDDVRLALFDREFVMNVGDSPLPEKDLPVTRWLDPGWTPKRPAKTTFHCFDEDAIAEVMRLVTFKTCAFCRTPMYEFPKDFQPGIVLLCDSCGYWGGRGTREWGYGPCNTRGILGRYRPLTGYDGIPADVLLRHLRRHPEGMRELSPRKAEQFVMDLLKEALNCDVKLMGGVKDHGVDGFIVRNDAIRSLVQVKWHHDSNRAEGVCVVREVAGTMLARGIPSAIIVSARTHFSQAARREADRISRTVVDSVGTLAMELRTYHDILDMLEIASRRINERIPREQLVQLRGADDCIFG